MRCLAWVVFLAAALTAFLPGPRDCREGRPRPSAERVSLPGEFEGEKLVAEPLT